MRDDLQPTGGPDPTELEGEMLDLVSGGVAPRWDPSG